MTGDQPTAEDVVQDAFLGLYRRWQALHDADKALGYLRSSVLNGCRSVHRVRLRRQGITLDPPEHAGSAEAEAMLGEAHREVLAALRRLPRRQREAVVLRYYLDMTEDQAAQAMGVSRGTSSRLRPVASPPSPAFSRRRRQVSIEDRVRAATRARTDLVRDIRPWSSPASGPRPPPGPAPAAGSTGVLPSRPRPWSRPLP